METKSSLASKINWTQVVAFLAMLATMVSPEFGAQLTPEFQAVMVAAILAVSNAVTLIMRTFFTTKVTRASAVRARP